MKNAPLFIISGPSGAGKTTQVERLLSEFNSLHQIATYTTRLPRDAERNGIDYNFVTIDEFKTLTQNKKFIETNCYSGNWYATHIELFDRIAAGQPCVVIPDINGAEKITAAIPEAITIWLQASEAVLQKRLSSRNTESHAAVTKRLQIALVEIEYVRKNKTYQHIIDTQDGESAYQELRTIVAHFLSS